MTTRLRMHGTAASRLASPLRLAVSMSAVARFAVFMFTMLMLTGLLTATQAYASSNGNSTTATAAASSSSEQQVAAEIPPSADYASWHELAGALVAQIDEAVQRYHAQDRTTALAQLNQSYYEGYVSSNMAQALTQAVGGEQNQRIAALFDQLKTALNQPNNAAQVGQLKGQLASALHEAAQQIQSHPNMASPRAYAQERAEQTRKDRERLQAQKQTVHEGRGERTWSEIAQDMGRIIDEADQLNRAGHGKQGAEKVNEAYYQYYEKLGFEKTVMNAISGSRVTLVESRFKELRKAMNRGDDSASVTQQSNELKQLLTQDATTLDQHDGTTSNSWISMVTSAAGQSFLILIREGLEALLVVVAVVAYLIKAGARRLVRWIYAGVLAALMASAAVAVVFMKLFSGNGPVQEVMEGVVALIAMVMLLYTGNWMLSKSSGHAFTQYLREKTQRVLDEHNVMGAQPAVNQHALSDLATKNPAEPAGLTQSASTQGAATQGGSTQSVANQSPSTPSLAAITSLMTLSFLAVFREGAETVLFYQSVYSMTQDATGMWVGGLLATAVLVVLFVLIRYTSVRIPLKPFFVVTSLLMAVLVVMFAGSGVHALIEGDVLPGMYLPTVPTNEWVGWYPYVETIAAQGLAALVVIGLYAYNAVKSNALKSGTATEKSQ